MTNDLNFLNVYTQVVDENVSAIIKQNFVFQTQLKIAENKLAQFEDAKQTVDKLTIDNKELQRKVLELSNLTSSYKSVTDDKSRLQVSLNETSQLRNQLQSDLNSAQQELARLRNQVIEFEAMKKENDSLKKKLNKQNKQDNKPVEELKATAGTF